MLPFEKWGRISLSPHSVRLVQFQNACSTFILDFKVNQRARLAKRALEGWNEGFEHYNAKHQWGENKKHMFRKRFTTREEHNERNNQVSYFGHGFGVFLNATTTTALKVATAAAATATAATTATAAATFEAETE